jgi:hypothetical protein
MNLKLGHKSTIYFQVSLDDKLKTTPVTCVTGLIIVTLQDSDEKLINLQEKFLYKQQNIMNI